MNNNKSKNSINNSAYDFDNQSYEVIRNQGGNKTKKWWDKWKHLYRTPVNLPPPPFEDE